MERLPERREGYSLDLDSTVFERYGQLFWFSEGNSSYNALQADLTRRLSRGLQFRGNYTWSKNLDIASGVSGSQSRNELQNLLNPYNPHRDWGPSAMNATHQASGNFNYELPIGHGQRWLKGVTDAADIPKGSHPYGMAIGGDKMIWYVSNYGNEVVRLNPEIGNLTRYPAPTPRSDLRRMAADAEGNLWAGAHDAGKLLKADYRTGKLTEYSPPTDDSGPYSIDVDMKRNRIWFSEHYADKIGWFDPRTNSFAEFPLPSPGLDVRRIEIDRSHPNRVWWSGWLADKIGYIEVIE